MKISGPRIYTNLSLFNCKYNVCSIITQIPKIFATGICEAATETQSIGIHDAYLFNTKLAMHCRAIFKYGCFVSLRRLCCRVLAIISRGKSKTGPDWLFFSFNVLCKWFFDRFHEKIEVIGQIRWEWKLHVYVPTRAPWTKLYCSRPHSQLRRLRRPAAR